jgi:hypothetical protein
MSFQAGWLDTTQRLLAVVESRPLDGFQAARAALLRGHLALVLNYGKDAPLLLLEAARQLEAFDLELAREAYLTAYGSATSAAHLGQAGALLDICRHRRLPPAQDDPDRKPPAG